MAIVETSGLAFVAYDKDGRMIQTPFVPPAGAARLTEKRATDIALAFPKIADWLDRYPPKPQTDAEFRASTDEWIVKAW